MAATYAAGDRVRVRHRPDGTSWNDAHLVDGTVWSYGPDDQTYWVVPDQPQADMIQGCIKASLALMEPVTEATLW